MGRILDSRETAISRMGRRAGTAGFGLKAEAALEAAGIDKAKPRPKGAGALLIPSDSNHSGKARMVEAAGVEPASENVPQKALQA